MKPACPLRTLQDFLATRLVAGTPCLCGFSGGCDSTALLLALWQLKIPVTAVHFHHGLRGQDADDDEGWCREFCETRQIPFHSQRLNVRQCCRPGESVEEASRRLRLTAWQSLAANGEPILLAHHADDCLENLFLRLARGSNASGLTGLRPETRLQGLWILRPFLSLRKAELADFLRQQGIADWRQDFTNDDNDYRRNAVRNLLLPLWRDKFGDDLGLLRSLKALQDDADLLSQMADETVAKDLTLDAWRKIPPALLPRVLRLWLEKQGEWVPPSYATINRLAQELAQFHGETRQIPLDNERSLRLDQRGLAIWADQTPPDRHTWAWSKTPVLDWPGWGQLQAEILAQPEASNDRSGEKFLLTSLPTSLTVRTWCPGDTMKPFGAKFTRKLQNIFTDAKIPRDLRAIWPVVEANGTIIWIPGVKRAEIGRCSPGAQSILLTFQRHS